MSEQIKRTFLIDQNLFFKFKSYIAKERIPSYSIVLNTLIEQYLKTPTIINEIVKSSKTKKIIQNSIPEEESSIKE